MISLIISTLILVALLPVIFNFRNIFGLGIYNKEDDYFNSYSDGTAGINLHLQLDHEFDNRYAIYTDIEPISTGDVVNYGILSIIIHYFADSKPAFATSIQFGTPRSNCSVQRIFLKLFKNTNLSCSGTIEISLETGGIPINDTINFQLTFIVPISKEDYRNIDLALYVLLFFHFFLFVIIPVVLLWIFKPVLGLTYTEEDKKRDEKFQMYLRDLVNEKRKKEKN